MLTSETVCHGFNHSCHTEGISSIGKTSRIAFLSRGPYAVCAYDITQSLLSRCFSD